MQGRYLSTFSSLVPLSQKNRRVKNCIVEDQRCRKIDPSAIFQAAIRKPIFLATTTRVSLVFHRFLNEQTSNRPREMAANSVPSNPRRKQRRTKRGVPEIHLATAPFSPFFPFHLQFLFFPLSFLFFLFYSSVQVHFCFAPFNGPEFSECLPGGWLKMNFT